MDGDGRAGTEIIHFSLGDTVLIIFGDYVIWDDQGGLNGFLNKRTYLKTVHFYVDQGPAKTIADSITQNPKSITLADLDG